MVPRALLFVVSAACGGPAVGLVTRASVVVPWTEGLLLQDPEKLVTVSASVDGSLASFGGNGEIELPSAQWDAEAVLLAARVCRGLEAAPRRALVLGSGALALAACAVLRALGSETARTSPTDSGSPDYVHPAALEEAYDLLFDFAGAERTRDPRYRGMMSAAAKTAVEDGLFAATPSKAEPIALEPSPLLPALFAAMPQPRWPAPTRNPIVFAPARLALGADAPADEYLDYIAWPRDVDTGRRLGIDLLLADDPVPSVWDLAERVYDHRHRAWRSDSRPAPARPGTTPDR